MSISFRARVMIINGDGGYTVYYNCLVYIDLGGPAAQAGWLGPKVGSHLAPFCIHRVNRVNSRNGSGSSSAMMTAPLISSWLLLLLLLLLLLYYQVQILFQNTQRPGWVGQISRPSSISDVSK